jgi:hypothetical protein
MAGKCDNDWSHVILLLVSNKYIIYKTLDFHGGDYEECRILGCDEEWLL